jgi:hypothetical protein
MQHQHVVGKARGEPEIMRHHDDEHAACRRSCARFFMTSIWCRGSSEAVGSSARMTGASTASARASATRLRSPPDNSVTRRSLNSHHVHRLHRAQHRLGIPWRQPRRIGRAMRIAPERHDIARRQRPVHDMALRQIAEAFCALAQRQRSQRMAADLDDRLRTGSNRQRRNSVVLPAPFGPTSATR